MLVLHHRPDCKQAPQHRVPTILQPPLRRAAEVRIAPRDHRAVVASGRRRRIQSEKAREYIRQNFRTDDDEELMGALEHVGLGAEQEDEMEEDEEIRTSKKCGRGRKRSKKRNPIIADECDVSKRAREDDAEEEDDD